MVEELNENNKRGKVYFVNNDLLYLPSIAETCGFEAKVNQTSIIENGISEALVYSPDFLVANVSFGKFREYLENLAKFKELSPKTKIIVTGDPFLTYNNNVTYENPFLDYVIMGETEYVFRDIIEGEDNSKIMGICYTDDNMQAAKSEIRPFIENLDNLPYPARHLMKNNKTVVIEVSRGCPYHCFFCLATVKNGAAYRVRTPESIINEIKYCIEKYGTKHIYFKADNFNFDKNWVLELCEKIISSGLNFDWYCDLTPKNIDDNMADLMKKSGCSLCRIGAESGSSEILEKLDKDITKESIIETVKVLKKHKIKTLSMFMFGLPWETEETAEETTKFALELNSDDTIFNIAIPLPATKFFVYAMLNRFFVDKPDFTESATKVIVKTHKLSREKVAEIKNLAEKRYYNQPRFIIRNYLRRIFNRH